MPHILVMGAGKIGKTLAHLLTKIGQYHVYLADINIKSKALTQLAHKSKLLELIPLDVNQPQQIIDFLTEHPVSTIISSLPYFLNLKIAKIAKQQNLHYFDLTEDTKTAEAVTELAKDSEQAFVPQCGLAPGLINIIANDLIQHFTKTDIVKLRCGALPIHSSNALQYALTWSTDGLINEYDNPCPAIENGQPVLLPPLSDLEKIQIDGLNYEAFNTSGGIGTLTKSYVGKVTTMNYKSIRYPGHCEKIRFLMRDLKLNEDRDTLKKILEKAIPSTHQDVVIVYVAVNGYKEDEFYKENYVKKYYPKTIDDITYSAIQITTASSACTIVDLVLQNSSHYHGMLHQEDFALNDVLNNRFGQFGLGNHDKNNESLKKT